MAISTQKDFIDTSDFSKEEILKIVDLAFALKKCIDNGYYPPLLQNKSLGMIFEQASTRTRVSFETAMTDLGGHGQYLAPGQIQLGKRETIYDTANVLSELLDVVMARMSSHENMLELAKHSTIPVINGMTDYNHPTQEIGDLCTIIQNLPEGKKLEDCKLVFVGDKTQVGASLLLLTSKLGIDFVQYGPSAYHIGSPYTDIADANIADGSGAAYLLTDNADAAFAGGADFVYTDVWDGIYYSYEGVSKEEAEASRKEAYEIFYPKYQVNDELMAKASAELPQGQRAKFMHCLPATRGNEVTDSVCDSPDSLIFQEAGNRKTSIRALLAYFASETKGTLASREEAKSELDKLLESL